LNIWHVKEQYHKLLENVRQAAQRDLILDEKFIESKFEIEKVLEPLSAEEKEEQRQSLQLIINQAYVNRELRQKGKFAEDKREVQNLKYLGYRINKNSLIMKEKKFIK
jgi:hypothetical protein